ncbi:hypothetical protein QCA50_011157 [Cerrena zonata]|uniref:F-box domain-containing protein n=1 Tax=Cerrena zonata TaxID=2478898 RepID=A0AAW0FYB3_9APHY
MTSAPPHCTNIEEARRILEHDIEVETKKVVDLKIRLNQLVPIARLPPELLSEIFLQCITMNAPNNRLFHRTMSHTSRWKVTQVCHYWREVALHCPSLWSQIEVSGPETDCISEMLTRSKKASLTVHADIFDPRDTKGVKKVLSEVDRIKSLEISAVRTAFTDVFDTPPTSAPRLKRIVIRNASASADDIPPFFSNCSLPSLQVVQLYNFPIPFTHPFFASTLTRLVFVAFASAHYTTPRVSDLTHMLTGMPLLQHLEYSGVLIGDDAGPRNVALTRLSYLNLYNDFSSQILPFGKLLDHLSIPSSAKVLLDFTSAELIDILPHLTASIIRMLTGDGRIGGVTPLRAFSIRNQAEGNTSGCVLSFWPDARSLKERKSPYPEPPFRIALPWVANLSDETWAFCRALPLSNVEACVLGCSPREQQEGPNFAEWQKTLGQMRKLVWLRVAGEGGTYFPDLLERLNHPEGSGKKRSAKLETLIMEGVKFRPVKELTSDVYIKDLIRVISELPNLKKLELKDCVNFGHADYAGFVKKDIPATWDRNVKFEKNLDYGGFLYDLDSEDGMDDTDMWDSDIDEADDNIIFGLF